MASLNAHEPVPPLAGHLPMGTASIQVDSRVVRRDGRPWLPVSGEFHFSRFSSAFWRRELLLMRAGGIDLVATYLFWNHHEEVRGHHRFDGDRDVRRFVELCAELGLAVAVRVGPWSHGECRNGGFPGDMHQLPFRPSTSDKPLPSGDRCDETFSNPGRTRRPTAAHRRRPGVGR